MTAPDNATAPDSEGWIGWGGGKCPVSVFTLVEVRLQSGSIGFGIAGHWIDRWSNAWEHIGPSSDEYITSYRVVQS